MSDLGAIFHVKKNGTQYDAHAYTTLDECPYPNLKIKTKSGTQGYVKLTTNGQGDVPLRVKGKAGTTYQVLAEATPTGSVDLTSVPLIRVTSYTDGVYYYTNKNIDSTTVTIPKGINVVKITYNNTSVYVGVTGGKQYNICHYYNKALFSSKEYVYLFSKYKGSFSYRDSTYDYRYILWLNKFTEYVSGAIFTISWSPEINKQTPTITDY